MKWGIKFLIDYVFSELPFLQIRCTFFSKLSNYNFDSDKNRQNYFFLYHQFCFVLLYYFLIKLFIIKHD